MDKHQKEKLLQILEHVRQRPGMYLGSTGLTPPVVLFAEGFNLAAFASNVDLIPVYNKTYQEVLANRGWTDPDTMTKPAWRLMQERGMDEEAITDEMLSIYALVWETILIPETVEHK